MKTTTTLQNYLENLSDFPNEKLAVMKEFPIESEDFQFSGVPKETLLEHIKSFFVLRGFNISESSLHGAFNIKKAGKLVAFFIFTPVSKSNNAFVAVNLWNH